MTVSTEVEISRPQISELRPNPDAAIVIVTPAYTDAFTNRIVASVPKRSVRWRLARCWEELALTDWEERHEAFHTALLAASTSPWLMRFYVQIKDQLRRHHRVLSIAPALSHARSGARWQDSPGFAALRDALALEPHTALMNAALDRDADRAVRLLAEHIEFTRKVFLATDLDPAPGRTA